MTGKLLTWLVMPLTLFMLVMPCLAWRAGRAAPGPAVLLGLAWLVLVVLSLPMTAAGLQIALQRQVDVPFVAEGRSDLGLVLGGMLSPPRRAGGLPELSSSINRAQVAVELVTTGRLRRLLVLGGNQPEARDRIPEAESVKALMVQWGVPAARIRIETASTSTRENAQAAMMLDIPPGSWLITSAWHMPRALVEFGCVGIRLRPYPVGLVHRYPSGVFAWLPTAEAMAGTSRLLKEWLGLAVAHWRCGVT